MFFMWIRLSLTTVPLVTFAIDEVKSNQHSTCTKLVFGNICVSVSVNITLRFGETFLALSHLKKHNEDDQKDKKSRRCVVLRVGIWTLQEPKLWLRITSLKTAVCPTLHEANTQETEREAINLCEAQQHFNGKTKSTVSYISAEID